MKITAPIIILIAASVGIAPSAKATDTKPGQTIEVSEKSGIDLLDQWIKHGKLIFQYIDCNGGSLLGYAYKPNGGDWILLNNDLINVNKFLANEITSVNLSKKFMNDLPPYWLVSCMGQDIGQIITTNYAKAEWSFSKPRKGLYISPPDNEDKKRLVLLKKYALNPKAVVNGNSWTLRFNVIENQKSVEAWTFNGKLYPLQINSFSREFVTTY